MPHKTARLLYGEKPLNLRFPESVSVLEMKPLKGLPAPEDAVYKALDDPVGSPPLAEIAKGRKNACVVISDFTRPVPNKVILPPLLNVLERSGIHRENITILIATGMHRPNLGEELEYLVGKDIADNYTIVNHYCRRPETYRKIDEIDGAPIEINNHYLDADLKILTGLIEPHFYAGYSGGRKAILPGISSYETMKFMHSFKMIAHPKVTNCILEGNPFHEYGIRVTELAGADFILNVVITQTREVASVFAGHYDHAHLAGCDLVYRHSVIDLDERVDMVITSGGGYPLDATFYQISKALICSRDILKPGGTIVVACECREGLGNPEFCEIMRSICGYQEFCRQYADPKDFVIDQWCSQSIYQAVDHAGPIYVYSPAMPGDDLKAMGMIQINDLQETVDRLLPQHQKVMVVPEGPYVVGRVRD
ncbi:MAG: nickel-dependent lactate racemase [Deltaproteobacteria bacterium]|nr:nickel-dependent lactate racemase [Deltaproteobacteria bacterium]